MTEQRAQELREERDAALTAADTIVTTAETEERSLTDEEQETFDGHIARAGEIVAELEAADRLTAARAQLNTQLSYRVPSTQRVATEGAGEGRTGQAQTSTPARTSPPPPQPSGGATAASPAPTQTYRAEVLTPSYEPGDALGAIVFARMRHGTDMTAAREWVRTKFGEGSNQYRAMQQSTFTDGGALVSDNFVGSELIELLRAAAAIRRAGARSIPLVNGSATIPKVTGGSTAYWGFEGENITASQMTTGAVNLVEKKLTALVPFSNDWAKNASLEVTRLIRDDMVRSAANAEDVAFLRADGLTNEPKGIYYWVGAAGRTNSAGTSLANVRTDIRVSKNRLGNANAPMVRRAWFIHSRAANYMGWDLVDGNSNFAFPQMQQGEGANLGGGTVFEDNNIPITLGAGTDTEIYYVEMSECFIGDNGELEIEVFRNATYVDSGGNLRSGVSRDESVVRLIRKVDFAMRHTESAHVLEAVGYGA